MVHFLIPKVYLAIELIDFSANRVSDATKIYYSNRAVL